MSGLPVQDLIDQLIALESRPLLLLSSRVQTVQTQRTAFTEINARLLGLKNTIARLDEARFFHASKATSSNDSVLAATTGDNAVRGTFQFQVRSLVASHQLISRGFTDADRQPMGVGELTIEIGDGRLDRSTPLDRLNGGDGMRRGTIEITDSNGSSATIELSTVLTVRDVLTEINSRTDIRVQARVEGDHLLVEDQAGGEQLLTIRDVGGGHSAEDLGIAQQASDGDGRVIGYQIISLVDDTPLSTLNDGNGVGVGKTNHDIDITIGSRTFTIGLRGLLSAGVVGQAHTGTRLEVLNRGQGVRRGTFRITNRAGQTADIVIDDTVLTISDLTEKIKDAGIDVTAAVGAARGQLSIRDESTPPGGQAPGSLKIEDITGHAAADLGIVGETDDTPLTGSVIYQIDTLGDVIRAINYSYSVDESGQHQLNDVVEARINASGKGIDLVRISGTEEFTVGVGGGAVDSNAARDLGLVGTSEGGQLNARDVLAGLNTVLLSSLRGGRGIELGVVKLKAADGSQTTIDFTQAATVQDIIDLVNAATVDGTDQPSGIEAKLNQAGTGILFADESGDTGTQLKDITGRTIGDLFDLDDSIRQGVVTDFANGARTTGNLQLQYISLSTRVDDLNSGQGIAEGRLRITARNGQSAIIPINENQATVGDLITRINSLVFDGVEARLNRNGDGIEIVDTTEGSGRLEIVGLDSSTVAKDLNLEGEGVDFIDEDGVTQQRIDGSYEYTLQIDADDTLNDVRDKINKLGLDFRATIINDGSNTSPFHLIVNSQVSGTRGRLVFDTGTTGMSFDTLVQAQDAVAFFGGSGAENPIVLTSFTNTLSDVLEGVTIELLGTSDKPIDLSITQDIDTIANDLQTFVSSYNAVLDRIDDVTKFDADSQTRAVLFGDATVTLIQSRLRSVVLASVPGAEPGVTRLTSIGIHIGSGGRLRFDETEFRDLFASNPEAVEKLFTTEDHGLGDKLESMLDDLTRGFDGLLARKDDALQKREDLFRDRIEALEERLDRKRTRLQRQFQALEISLAGLQGAQNALATLAGVIVPLSSR